jgi:hypothetical protein
MLLKLKDGGIYKIESDSDAFSGCETCDHGSSYINEFIFTMEKGTILIESDQMYEHAMTDGYMMELILPNVDFIKGKTELEFFEWMKAHMYQKYGDVLKTCEFKIKKESVNT